MSNPDVIIIGAGVAGLAAAAALRQAGRSCVVLEASQRVGGRKAAPGNGGVGEVRRRPRTTASYL